MVRPAKRDYSNAPHKALGDRLISAAEINAAIPNFNDGLLSFISHQLHARYKQESSTEVIRRWFRGLSKPRDKTLRRLAEILDVDPYWLATGAEHAVSEKARKINSERQDGSVQFVAGAFRLSGFHSFTPDTEGEYMRYTDVVVVRESDIKQLVVRTTVSIDVENDDYMLRFPKLAPKQIAIVACATKNKIAKFSFYRIPHEVIEAGEPADGVGFTLKAAFEGTDIVLNQKTKLKAASSLAELVS